MPDLRDLPDEIPMSLVIGTKVTGLLLVIALANNLVRIYAEKLKNSEDLRLPFSLVRMLLGHAVLLAFWSLVLSS